VRIRLAIPDRFITPSVLEAALEATTRANQSMLRAGMAPSLTESIKGGLRWKPEPFTDGEHFDLASVAHRRGFGDCDDLAPWLAAEMRNGGLPARARVRRSGPGRYHVVVQDQTGKIHDPSRWAGMKGGSSFVSGVVSKPLARHGEAGIAVMPYRGRWHCRADLPWPGALGHMASMASHRTPGGALDRAVHGACIMGEAIGSPMLDRLAGVGEALLTGLDELEGADQVDGDDVGFLSSLYKMAKPFASMVPGGGIATSAIDALSKGKKGKKGGGGAAATQIGPPQSPTWIYYHPAHAPGPVVVRMA
jgi:hypothetical protein